MGTSRATALRRLDEPSLRGRFRRRPLPGGAIVIEQPIEEISPIKAVQRRDAAYRRMLAMADIVSAALALWVTFDLLGDDKVRPLVLLALPLVVLVAKLKGLYDRDALTLSKTTLDEAPHLFQVATLYALLVTIGSGMAIEGSLGTGQMIALWAALFFSAAACRTVARAAARASVQEERCIVIGDAATSRRISRKFAESPGIKACIVGWVPIGERQHSSTGAGRLGELSDLKALVQRHEIHRIIVAPQGTDSETMLDTIRMAKGFGVQVSVLPRMLEVIGSSAVFDNLYGITALGVRRFGLTRSSALIKRALDVTGAVFGLLILSPFFAAVALAIKLTDRGPVFFRQQRVGQEGAMFGMLKFRTMVVDAEERKAELVAMNEAADGLFKISEDPRITKVGRLLRRTSLDELPQLWNVLRGDMALVGPRPLIKEEDERIDRRHRRRLHLKPGMTGQWQIFGSSRIPVSEMVTIDYLYIANWSLWGDIKILLRTVPYMLAQRGR
jgi:exopolysaccharide biosynthesis polyprenyl glycosylphosphotransferase